MTERMENAKAELLVRVKMKMMERHDAPCDSTNERCHNQTFSLGGVFIIEDIELCVITERMGMQRQSCQ